MSSRLSSVGQLRDLATLLRGLLSWSESVKHCRHRQQSTILPRETSVVYCSVLDGVTFALRYSYCIAFLFAMDLRVSYNRIPNAGIAWFMGAWYVYSIEEMKAVPVSWGTGEADRVSSIDPLHDLSQTRSLSASYLLALPCHTIKSKKCQYEPFDFSNTMVDCLRTQLKSQGPKPYTNVEWQVSHACSIAALALRMAEGLVNSPR